MSKKILYIIILAVVVALVWWWWQSRQAVQAPTGVSDINQELEGLNLNELDNEFKQIDQELDTL